MHTALNRIFQHPLQSAFKLACVTAVLAGCGGGGSGPIGTTTFASGTITGFGSVIVDRKTRFDDSAAKIRSDDDDANEVHDKSELKLGMHIEVEAGDLTDDSTGRHSKASEIRFGSELVGPVGSVAPDSFTVLGQTVKVDPKTTIFDDSISGGFSPALAGMVVEVHGLFDSASKTYTATRVEAKTAAQSFKIRGAIDNIDTTAKTITIGSETISLDSIASLPALKVGDVVRVKVDKVKGATAWVALSIKSGVRKMEDHDEAEIKGAVKNFIDQSTLFEVNGTSVDAKNVASMPSLKDGDFVEVEGSIVNGVLVAKKVALEDSNSAGAGEFEFHRRISGTGTGTFDLGTAPNVTTISWDNTTSFVAPASSTSLTANTCVEVKAKLVGGTMHAVRIALDNTCTQ